MPARLLNPSWLPSVTVQLRKSQRSLSSRLLLFTTYACSRSRIVPLLAVLSGIGGTKQAFSESISAESGYFPPLELSAHPVIPFAKILEGLFLVWEGLRMVMRACFLLVLFSPALALSLVGGPGSKLRKTWLYLMHWSLERAGAAFIKWGQWAATRPDLFPQDLCAQLALLHSCAPAHSFQVSRRTVEDAFGQRLEDLFSEFEELPVASGSIAQVHRAVLRKRYPGMPCSPDDDSAGALVAVKVRHPGVSEMIRRDFDIIHTVAQLCSLLPGLRGLRLEESVQQFATFMMTQVDLAREASHLSRFRYNFRRWQSVSFPCPVYPLVHPSVLVESFELGESVTRYVNKSVTLRRAKEEAGGEDSSKDHISSELASLGSHTLLKMLLVDNFIHADLHPGNILVRVQRPSQLPQALTTPVQALKGQGQPHVVLLDVGMTAELSPRDRVTMLEFFRAVTLRDGHRVAECTLRFTEKQNCPNPALFIREVEDQFAEWDKRRGRVPTGECMQDLLESVRKHRVNIDGNVCTVMITTLVLEGWQRKLDPELSVMDTLHSMLFKSELATNLSYTIDGLLAP